MGTRVPWLERKVVRIFRPVPACFLMPDGLQRVRLECRTAALVVQAGLLVWIYSDRRAPGVACQPGPVFQSALDGFAPDGVGILVGPFLAEWVETWALFDPGGKISRAGLLVERLVFLEWRQPPVAFPSLAPVEPRGGRSLPLRKQVLKGWKSHGQGGSVATLL
jgi:hypothetical protein